MFSLKHDFECLLPDDPAAAAAGKVLISHWNEEHVLAMASGFFLGRATAGDGPVEELSPSDARTLLGLVTGTGAGNVPLLDGSGLLPTSILPALAITDSFEVASQAAMLALTAQKGDIAIRTDLNKTFVLSTNSPSTLADWKELRTPTDTVLAVAGLTGTITAAALKTALAMTVADVTDMSANGRSLVQAANFAAMFGLLKQGATETATGVMEFSTADEFRSAEASLALSPQRAWDAAVPVAATLSGSVTVDFSTFLHRVITATGNITLGATSNLKKGQSFVWEFIHSGAARTISLNTTYWSSPGGSGLSLSTSASARDILSGYVMDNGKVMISVAAKGVA